VGILDGGRKTTEHSDLDNQTRRIRRLAASDDLSVAGILDQSVVFIPAGRFVRGSNWGNSNEGPEQWVYLDAFEMDRYEVTNIQYSRFLAATGNQAPSSWIGGTYPDGQADFPVVGIGWRDANAYCGWAGKRLPTEAEWEKACRGPAGNVYPWGNEWDSSRANMDYPAASLVQPERDGSPTARAYA
jgi:formylglycine-generating enzyme required for sulfatase activity